MVLHFIFEINWFDKVSIDYHYGIDMHFNLRHEAFNHDNHDDVDDGGGGVVLMLP